ncbi:MAG: ATP synthase F0 subunit C, partial [Terriglobia bacterium]|jgi:F-type H+-transporting ATPase subunit c
MKRIVLTLTTVVGALLAATPAFAQGAAPVPASEKTIMWVAITSGFAMAIAAAVCGYSQSKVAAAACEGLARNPGARPGIQIALILGLAFIETLALLTLVVIFAKVIPNFAG